jgi:1-acyl-sn-glycerol-3-phosphate acyltransferase
VRRLGRNIYRIGGTLVGWAVWVVVSLLWGALLLPLTVLLAPVWPSVREHFATLTRWALRAYVRQLSFVRLCVEGAEKRLDGPRILVANHQSRLDSPVLLAIEPRLCGPVRGYMLRVPLLGTMIRLLGFFDADAEGAAVLDAMNRAAERARSRAGGLLFYPEGTRSKTGEIGPFRRGAFRAAVDHDLPIQPVVIEGFDAVLPPGRAITPVFGRYPVRIRYLEPLHPPYGTGPRRDVVRGLAEHVRTALVDELARMRAERRAIAATGVGSRRQP